ncbi:MAG: hypothetical protein WC488_02710 [Candidatus Micrarchaeia archaeon]
MRKKERPGKKFAKTLAIAVILISLLSIITFSVQYIYSNNLDIQVRKSYGLYQNGVFRDTADVEVPSQFAVRKTEIRVTNTADSARRAVLSMSHRGSVTSAEPSPKKFGSLLSWTLQIGPRETATVYVFGPDLETETPALTFVDYGAEQSVSNKKLFIPASSSESVVSDSTSFSYVREGASAGLIDSLVADQNKLDLFSKSAIVIFAGLVVLTLVGGLGSVLSSEEKPKSAQKTRILIAPRQEDYFSDRL